MLLIEARCDRSPIHGLGLFAVARVPAGTPVWRFEPGFDRAFTREQVDRLPDPARRHLFHFGFLDASAGAWVLNGDLSIFMNHSGTPTTGAPAATGPARETLALRDLEAGDEITCDYSAFDGSEKISELT
ncbi:MAG: SET domain-containing protein [Limisphaerales bacterium]